MPCADLELAAVARIRLRAALGVMLNSRATSSAPRGCGRIGRQREPDEASFANVRRAGKRRNAGDYVEKFENRRGREPAISFSTSGRLTAKGIAKKRQ